MRFDLNLQQLEWLEQFDEWLGAIARDYGYAGIFLISLLGTASIVIPIPYTVIIFTIGSLRILDPLFIAIAGGAGSALGEVSGYLLGYYGRAVIGEERRRKMDYIVRVFNRYGAITVFLFALTPLPDDLLFIPLGIMRYNFLKFFLPALLGKTLMCLILAYGGSLSIGFITAIFGGGGMWTTIVSAILLIIIIAVMLKVDWEKFFPLEGKEEIKPKA